jgi:hypothetical protein
MALDATTRVTAAQIDFSMPDPRVSGDDEETDVKDARRLERNKADLPELRSRPQVDDAQLPEGRSFRHKNLPAGGHVPSVLGLSLKDFCR